MLTVQDLDFVQTEDGSTTLRHRAMNVLYRSSHGARTESEHVFVQGSQITTKAPPWKVAELGFGGGCNFLCTAAHALQAGKALHYLSVDSSLQSFS